MADAGTLATTAQVLLAIGANASANQILETNTNIWILQAEADIYVESGIDFVTKYADVSANLKQYLALVASNRAAFYAINQDQNNWSLATTQSKLNVIDTIWQEGKKQFKSVEDLSGIV